MKVAFVCKHGEHRSATAADVAVELAGERGIDLSTTYFGITENRDLQKSVLADVEHVFVMEKEMVFDIKEVARFGGPIEVLDVEDGKFTTDELIKIFREYLRQHAIFQRNEPK